MMAISESNNEIDFNVLEFIETIESMYNVIPDKKIIEDRGRTIDYTDLIDLEAGRTTIMYSNVKMETLYIPNTKSEKLFVVLAGARTRNRGKEIAKLPQLNMWSWCKKLNVKYLFIEDPMYYQFQTLKQGWYYGDEKNDYRKLVADLIQKIIGIIGVKKKDVIVYGLSAGGSGALGVGKFLSGCSVIANNPQINYDEYLYSKEFNKITGLDIIEESKEGKRNDLIGGMSSSGTKFIILINALSLADTRLHLKRIIERYHFEPHLGINKITDNFIVFIYAAPAAPDAHTSIPTPPLVRSFIALADLMHNNADLDNYKEQFSIINSFYYEYYSLKRQNLITQDSVQKNLNIFTDQITSAHLTGRVDIKNSGNDTNDVEFNSISDANIIKFAPEWFGKSGKGYVLQSVLGELDLAFKCIGSGSLSITLRGKYIKDANEKNIPIWIDYTEFKVNDTDVINNSLPVCHDKPFRYTMDVNDGDVIKLHVKWEPHDPQRQIEE